MGKVQLKRKQKVQCSSQEVSLFQMYLEAWLNKVAFFSDLTLNNTGTFSGRIFKIVILLLDIAVTFHGGVLLVTVLGGALLVHSRKFKALGILVNFHCLPANKRFFFFFTNMSVFDLQSRLPTPSGQKRIRRERVPGKRDCENCIVKAKGALDCREWTAVKYYVKNQIDKRKRVLTTMNNSL